MSTPRGSRLEYLRSLPPLPEGIRADDSSSIYTEYTETPIASKYAHASTLLPRSTLPPQEELPEEHDKEQNHPILDIQFGEPSDIQLSAEVQNYTSSPRTKGIKQRLRSEISDRLRSLYASSFKNNNEQEDEDSLDLNGYAFSEKLSKHDNTPPVSSVKMAEMADHDHRVRKTLVGVVIALSVACITTLIALIYLLANRKTWSTQAKMMLAGEVVLSSIQYRPRDPDYAYIGPTDPEIAPILSSPHLWLSYQGVNYSPDFSIHGVCGTSQRDISRDIALLSRITRRIRLFSTDCYQADYVLHAITDLQLPLNISLGISLEGDELDVLRQLNDLRDVLQHFPEAPINAIFLGHNSLELGHVDVPTLSGYYKYVRGYLDREGYPEINVVLDESLEKWSDPKMKKLPDVVQGITTDPYQSIDHEISFNHRQILTNVTAGSRKNLAETWICDTSRGLDVEWYWSEAFDQPWRDVDGIFYTNRTIKPNALPGCTFPKRVETAW